jgi:hypothetical protein
MTHKKIGLADGRASVMKPTDIQIARYQAWTSMIVGAEPYDSPFLDALFGD